MDQISGDHHLGCIKPCKYWDKLPINWCRISSINGIYSTYIWLGSLYCICLLTYKSWCGSRDEKNHNDTDVSAPITLVAGVDVVVLLLVVALSSLLLFMMLLMIMLPLLRLLLLLI